MELGDTPPPLTESHCAQKNLAERGGTPPLTEKIRKVVFDRFPNSFCRLFRDISFLLLIHHHLKGGAATLVNLCQSRAHLSSHWMQFRLFLIPAYMALKYIGIV